MFGIFRKKIRIRRRRKFVNFKSLKLENKLWLFGVKYLVIFNEQKLGFDKERLVCYFPKNYTEELIINIYKKLARFYIEEKVTEFSRKFEIEFHKLKITRAHTRWGSCTSQRNLNFSYRLIFTPKFVIDYVICHELAHLTHMNHSKQFWNLVEEYYPNYKEAEKWLKENSRFL